MITVSRSKHLILAFSLAMGLLLIFLAVLPILKVRADSLTVTNTNDSGPGSLRQAIADAADGDTIDFDGGLNGQTIILTSGELLITKNLTIDGPSPNLLAISGNNNSRVFHITSTVTISRVTIRDGNAPDGGGIFNDGGGVSVANSSIFSNTATLGGGIYNAPAFLSDSGGTLMMTNSTISSNTAIWWGGGIANVPGMSSGTGGTVTMTNSSVFSNIANIGGGGILNGGTMTMDNVTVSSNTNTASPGGGGIAHDSGWSGGSLNLSNSTVTGNAAGDNGGGLALFSGPVTITNTIVAANRVGAIANDCFLGHATFTSGGYNLVQAPDASCVFAATSDITNTNPLLGPLADNGGDTLTHALLPGSPAIDHIPNGVNGCGTTFTADQRGITRPQGTACDIGAYEYSGGGDRIYMPLVVKS